MCEREHRDQGLPSALRCALGGAELPAEAPPLTMDSEDEALLIPAGRVQRRACVCARGGKLQARKLQHPPVWEKRRAGSQGRMEPGLSLGHRADPSPGSQPSSVEKCLSIKTPL